MKGKFILSLVLMVMLFLFVSGCDELFPEPRGRTNPNDPYSPVESIYVAIGDGASFICDVRFRDFKDWDDDVDPPGFFVIVFDDGEFAPDPAGKTVLAAFSLDSIYTYTDAERYWHGQAGMESFYGTASGVYSMQNTLAVFWADKYESTMATLTDSDPANDNFSGNWSGPVAAQTVMTIIVPDAHVVIDTEYNMIVDPAGITLGYDAQSWGLIHFTSDINASVSEAYLLLYAYGSDSITDLTIGQCDFDWNVGMDSEVLLQELADYSTGHSSNTYTVENSERYYRFSIYDFFYNWQFNGAVNQGIVLSSGSQNRMFAGNDSEHPPLIMIMQYETAADGM
ncbi:MAG: hypothetical protein JW874_08440 [Spirochaetales bacterium]|nr:hypothetical protein [Spirochaetales bacterium]